MEGGENTRENNCTTGREIFRGLGFGGWRGGGRRMRGSEIRSPRPGRREILLSGVASAFLGVGWGAIALCESCNGEVPMINFQFLRKNLTFTF